MESLKILSINYLVKNLYHYENDFDSTIKPLPSNIKDQLLHRFCIFPAFWKRVCFKKVLRALIHHNTSHLDFCFHVIDDEVVNILKQSRNLKFISLFGNEENLVTSQGLLGLVCYLKLLRVLQVPHCDAVNDIFLTNVAHNCSQLAGLNVEGCVNITDESLKAMSNMKNLTWIKLSATGITIIGMKSLITGASGLKLKELRLANCRLLDSAVLNIIVQNCPNIEVLVFYNTPVNEEDLENIHFTKDGSLKHLKQLTWTIQ